MRYSRFGLFIVLATSAIAQGPAAGPRERGIRFLGAQPGRPGQVVKGAPYSADISSEVTQVLSDGNKIHQTSTERAYRDSEGRTRREPSLSVPGTAGGTNAPQVAFIDDPVAGVTYVLDMAARTGTRQPWRQPPAGRGPGPVNQGPRQQAARPDAKTESLGRQVVAGVPADGTRTTRTIPTGEVGNALPIQIITERWYSPDLQTVVLMKRSDPRSGESVYQLTNIIRAEPPSTLFVPPADFQVSQGLMPRRGLRGGAPQ